MVGAYIYSMQIQEVNEKYEHCSMECKALKQQKIQVLDKLENLDGIPEKYRKQCDIMTNALQALQNQDGKWATKVMHSTKHFSASLLLNRV
jgi:chromosome segregation ATPase